MIFLFGWLSFVCCEQHTAPARSGAVVYQTYCTHCHQANGEGLDSRYPPLSGSEWLKGTLPAKILLNGLQGEITVKGKHFSNVMAPWGDVLSDEEIAEVIGFIRSSWENKEMFNGEKPLTAVEVAEIRKQYLHNKSWTSSTLISSEQKNTSSE